MSGPLIRLSGVTKTYGQGRLAFQDLKGIDLSVENGDFVAVMGPSGSGKSTTMNILGCLDTPSGGTYEFLGVPVERLERDQRALLRRHFLGFVFQGFNLLARTTALENVELPLIYRGHAASERRTLARAALKQVGRLGAPHAGRTVRRAAAARGHRPGHSHFAFGAAGRRTHGKSGHAHQRGNHGSDRLLQPRPRHHRAHGHP